MLCLNESTLFYYGFRTSKGKPKHAGVVKDWAAKVTQSQKSSKPGAPSSLTLKSGMAPKTSTKLSSLVDDSDDSYTIDDELMESKKSVPVDLWDDDGDEPEHQAALSSPHKGRKRLTSQVCKWLLFHI